MQYLYDPRTTATSAAIPETVITKISTTEETAQARAPHIGDIVLFVLDGGSNAGQERPAFVVRIFAGQGERANLQVFTDSYNDFPAGQFGCSGILWRTSAPYSATGERGTWHYPTATTMPALSMPE